MITSITIFAMNSAIALIFFTCSTVFQSDAEPETLQQLSSEDQASIMKDLDRSGIFPNPNLYQCPHAKYDICSCELNCSKFGDCCINLSPRHRKIYACEQLGITSPPRNFYMVKKCPVRWTYNYTKNLCEKNSKDAVATTYRTDVPVYDRRVRTLYRNYFCFFCHGGYQNDVYNWKDRILWLGIPPKRNISTLGTETAYDPYNRYFEVKWDGKTYYAVYDAEDFYDKNFDITFNTKVCQQAISDCPKNDAELRKTCNSYTAFVHDKNAVYRNYHCALCYDRPTGYLIPGLPPPAPSPTVPPPHKLNIWLGDIFDFSRDDLTSCPTGKLFDVFLQKCIPFKCPDGTTWDGSVHCVSKDGAKGCTWVTYDIDWVILQENGELILKHSNLVFYVGEYVTITKTNGDPTHVRVCLKYPITLTLNYYQELLSEICLIISIICLMFLIIVYSTFGKLRNRPGKAVMCLSVTIIMGHLSFLLAADIAPATKLCYVVAVIAHYFYTCSFFWMNVMAIDVCRSLVFSVFDSDHSHIFLWYNLYSWITPGLIVMAAIILDRQEPDGKLSPRFGTTTCWIANPHSVFIFFVIPIAIILIANVVLFGITTHSLRKGDKRREGITRVADRIRFTAYIKLAMVSGLTWLFGFLAALTKLKEMWYPFIILNGLQGAFLFLTFILNARVFAIVKDSWRRRIASEQSNSTTYIRFASRLSTVVNSFRKPNKVSVSESLRSQVRSYPVTQLVQEAGNPDEKDSKEMNRAEPLLSIKERTEHNQTDMETNC